MTRRLVAALAACGLSGGIASAADHQDFLFLTEARPVLVRVQAHLDGKPVAQGWNALMQHIFTSLDKDKSGGLTKAEAERIPTVANIFSGGLGGLVGGAGAAPKFEDVDQNKNGTVSSKELADYYRKNGLAPFQFQLSPPISPLAQAGLTRNLEPPVQAVAQATFHRLDTNGDGKITMEELAAATTTLQNRDENDDEILTAKEVAPDAKPLGGGGAGMAMMMGRGQAAAPSNHMIVAIPESGVAPPTLAAALRHRYGPKPAKAGGGWFASLLHTARTGRLNRTQLGLDEQSFNRLDANKDGRLDATEMAGLVKTTPDLELAVWLGRDESSPRVEIKGGPLGARSRTAASGARLDLGATRVTLQSKAVEEENSYGNYIEEMLTGLVKQADANADGVIDEKEIQASAQFRGLLKSADLDGNGKVTAKEIDTYFEDARELQRRAEAGCASLWLSDQSRGLFDLMDTDRDGRLSLRELRGATALLAEFGGAKKHVVKEDLPRSYGVEFRVGPASAGPLNQITAVLELYRGASGYEVKGGPNAGPLWMRKMDRNRDGDVSRREWLFSPEQFQKLDRDGDGLISPEEAKQSGDDKK